MKIRSLDFDQFQLEKKQIADKLISWQEIVRKYAEENYLSCTDTGSISFWETAVKNVINYFLNEFEASDVQAYKKASFRLFVVEDEGRLEGISFGRVKDYSYKADTFFGIKQGIGFEIDEILVSPDNLLPRCYPELKYPQKHIEKTLIQSAIEFVQTMKSVCPIVVRPSNSDTWTEQFLESNLFVGSGGAFGSSFKLVPNNFNFVTKSREESIGSNLVLIIDDYDNSSRTFGHK